jgi:tRNA U34 5-methylaminomethyl-2-thiouridine-forming methyltransferase MnmC
MPNISIITTSDGSHSLLNTDLNETYHSTHGAIRESLHVFIKNGFDFVVERKKMDAPLEILEIGFGTGLNALLTLQKATADNVKVRYTTVEAYPLEERIWNNLNYTESIGFKTIYEQFHQSTWNEDHLITKYFTFCKINSRLEAMNLPGNFFDLIYFDAFAPSKQPEMWQASALKHVTDSMKFNASFVTYCAKGQVKRDLKSFGLMVETLPGPPGKKEMIRATKKENADYRFP